MLTIKILTAIYFGITSFDAWLTAKRMNKYGLSVELTSTIRRIARVSNPETAAILGILVPSVAVCVLCLWFNWIVVISILLGFRLQLFYIQLQSLVFEKQLIAFKKEHPEVFGGQSSENALTPPARPGHAGDSTTAPLDSKGEEKHG